MQSYSQADQDKFVLLCTNFKRGGYFLEIGAYHPTITSNTYLLESEYDWRGVSIEYDTTHKPLFESMRKSVSVFQDARTINYAELLKDAPQHIDYLQVDLDVSNRSTLDVIEKLDREVMNTHSFGVITIEHDIYTGNYFDTQQNSREILTRRGYMLLFPNVQVEFGGRVPFEDWWVHPSLGVKTSSYKSLFHPDVIEMMTQEHVSVTRDSVTRDSVPKVLFLNHKIQQCGVYQYGMRLYNILKQSDKMMYIYKEIGSIDDYHTALKEEGIEMVIYNYHVSTMPWLNNLTMQRQVKNISLAHESQDDIFDIKINIEDIPRPIYENVESLLSAYRPSTDTIRQFIEYKEDGVPVFGSFGFGFINKGFYRIVNMINNQYDHAIIKLLIPDAHFDPNRSSTYDQHAQLCKQMNVKPGIKLMFSREFFTNEDVLMFLRSNTMNIFLYDRMEGRGISSAIDYALSVSTPLGISNSAMFRHIYADCIDLEKVSVRECMLNSVAYCDALRKKHSNAELVTKFDAAIAY